MGKEAAIADIARSGLEHLKAAPGAAKDLAVRGYEGAKALPGQLYSGAKELPGRARELAKETFDSDALRMARERMPSPPVFEGPNMPLGIATERYEQALSADASRALRNRMIAGGVGGAAMGGAGGYAAGGEDYGLEGALGGAALGGLAGAAGGRQIGTRSLRELHANM